MKLSLKSNHFCANRFRTLELENGLFLTDIRYLKVEKEKKKRKNLRNNFSREYFSRVDAAESDS